MDSTKVRVKLPFMTKQESRKTEGSACTTLRHRGTVPQARGAVALMPRAQKAGSSDRLRVLQLFHL